MSSDPK